MTFYVCPMGMKSLNFRIEKFLNNLKLETKWQKLKISHTKKRQLKKFLS